MELKPTECRSCGQSIVWMKTEAGKNIPVDPESLDAEDLEADATGTAPLFDAKRHISHFATCPDADTHRKPTKKWQYATIIAGNTQIDVAFSGDLLKVRKAPDGKTTQVQLAGQLKGRPRIIVE